MRLESEGKKKENDEREREGVWALIMLGSLPACHLTRRNSLAAQRTSLALPDLLSRNRYLRIKPNDLARGICDFLSVVPLADRHSKHRTTDIFWKSHKTTQRAFERGLDFNVGERFVPYGYFVVSVLRAEWFSWLFPKRC